MTKNMMCFKPEVLKVIKEALYCYKWTEEDHLTDDEFEEIDFIQTDIENYLDKIGVVKNE